MTEIEQALAFCKAARQAAALPLHFVKAAEDKANLESLGQFQRNMTLVGGFANPKVKDSLLRASTLYGELAKAFALFQKPGTKEILVRHADRAREIMEQECHLRVAHVKGKPVQNVTVNDGVMC